MIGKLSELISRRNQCELELLRAQAELDAFLLAEGINARESASEGSGVPAPVRPRPIPARAVKYLDRANRPEV